MKATKKLLGILFFSLFFQNIVAADLPDDKLQDLVSRTVRNAQFDLGYPGNQNIALNDFYQWYTGSGLNQIFLNNAGDPFSPKNKLNSLEIERNVIEFFAPLYGFDSKTAWGIITMSGTDGNNHGIYFGYKLLKSQTKLEPILYVSKEAHYSNKRLADLQTSMKELQAYTKTPLAVENMPRTGMLNTSAELMYFAEQMGKVDYCIDVNHFLRETPDEAIENIGKYTITLHISDHDYADEKHWLPGKGKIDWQKVIAALEKANYQGVWNYELVNPNPVEVKQNYDWLFDAYNKR